MKPSLGVLAAGVLLLGVPAARAAAPDAKAAVAGKIPDAKDDGGSVIVHLAAASGRWVRVDAAETVGAHKLDVQGWVSAPLLAARARGQAPLDSAPAAPCANPVTTCP